MTDEETKRLASILDSKTAQKAYDEGLSESVSEAGGFLTDVLVDSGSNRNTAVLQKE